MRMLRSYYSFSCCNNIVIIPSIMLRRMGSMTHVVFMGHGGTDSPLCYSSSAAATSLTSRGGRSSGRKHHAHPIRPRRFPLIAPPSPGTALQTTTTTTTQTLRGTTATALHDNLPPRGRMMIPLCANPTSHQLNASSVIEEGVSGGFGGVVRAGGVDHQRRTTGRGIVVVVGGAAIASIGGSALRIATRPLERSARLRRRMLRFLPNGNFGLRFPPLVRLRGEMNRRGNHHPSIIIIVGTTTTTSSTRRTYAWVG
mmetsp:Transcript_26210/g.56268  ORF Transcript_26210/g.56268 Transcript_26210/m.56268 type:complete len:255 (-) Transcript_26210:945-1709(-)